jgi:hypothetical protein
VLQQRNGQVERPTQVRIAAPKGFVELDAFEAIDAVIRASMASMKFCKIPVRAQ